MACAALRLLSRLGMVTHICYPTLERLKKEDCHEFEASLGWNESLSLKINTYFVEEN